MQANRMLVSTAAILAASAVVWAQDPDSKAKADPPGATREYRIIVNQAKDAKGTTDGPSAPKPATATFAPPGATQRVRLLRAQEAARGKEGEAGKGQMAKAIINARVLADDDAEVLNRVIRLHDDKANDPHREILLRLKAVASESCVQCHAGGVSVRNDEALGLSVVPADETLRSQLKLDGKGLVVTAVEHGTPGDAGGVKEKDIVVVVAGKPVATVEDFQKILKIGGVGGGSAEARREPIVVKVVRAGETKEIRVPPPGMPSLKVGSLKITSVRHQPSAPSYWIGVAIGEVDDTLRAHLKLDEGAGLVLTDVIKESPAAKVGLEKNDVLLTVDGRPVKAPDDLVKAVQAAKDEAALKLAVRRAGDKLTVTVRPEKRKEVVAPAFPTPLQGFTELKVGEQPQAWVAQLLPFLDGQGNQINWATPGQPGLMYLWNQPNQLNQPNAAQGFAFHPYHALEADAQKKLADAEVKKVTEALNLQVSSLHQQLATRFQAEEAQRKAVVDLVKKAAAPPETLARIDAQLKALEAQVGDIKRSMDELKAAIKKEQR